MSESLVKIKEIIKNNQLKNDEFRHFVLQGGAGSGKTESLKDIISYISENFPNKKVACITHTNVASNEIESRVGSNPNFTFSTIHSFLTSLISNFNKNIKEVIHIIYCIEKVNEEDHKLYKKSLEKFNSKQFTINNKNGEPPIKKRDYDQNPSKYNLELNQKIEILNKQINKIIQSKNYKDISYSQTRFDSLDNMSYSHDSLLIIAYELCNKFKILPKIISDKYDFIFIDEYQDTNEIIIDLFLNLLPANKDTTIGMFGDSMQGIYDDGIGDLNEKIKIERINKEDNYRCSQEVIKFINHIRTDEIEQKLALKKGEEIEDRSGKVTFYYSIYGNKPTTYSSSHDKNNYLSKLETIINEVKKKFNGDKPKILMLTNKSISQEVGFSNLYSTFSNRYTEVKEEIEKELSKLLVSDLVELCRLYTIKKFNPIILHLKKNGFQINSVQDKQTISSHFKYLLNEDISISEAIDYSIENKIINESDTYKNYINKKNLYIKEFNDNEENLKLEHLFKNGSNTRKRLMDNHNLEISDEKFNEFSKSLKKKDFYIDLFSKKMKLYEAINYYNYLNEETEYITMHKTKGSGIQNVIVILDEYFWNKYNFKSIYDSSIESSKRIKNQKLFYVASSRTINQLSIIRLIKDKSEESIMKEYFKECEIVE